MAYILVPIAVLIAVEASLANRRRLSLRAGPQPARFSNAGRTPCALNMTYAIRLVHLMLPAGFAAETNFVNIALEDIQRQSRRHKFHRPNSRLCAEHLPGICVSGIISGLCLYRNR
jgi:hypothetical protein